MAAGVPPSRGRCCFDKHRVLLGICTFTISRSTCIGLSARGNHRSALLGCMARLPHPPCQGRTSSYIHDLGICTAGAHDRVVLSFSWQSLDPFAADSKCTLPILGMAQRRSHCDGICILKREDQRTGLGLAFMDEVRDATKLSRNAY
jgi:hypothetical protein